MSVRDRAIAELVSELEPAPAFRPPGRLVLLWLALSWGFVVTATVLVAPFRPGAFEQLATHPHFALETLVGFSAGAVAIAAGIFHGFPGREGVKRWTSFAFGLLGLWLGAHVLAIWAPAVEPSMLGKRAACVFEVLLYGSPPLLAGLFLLRRFAPLRRVRAGLLVGAAAGALPALLMQLACMYLPEHILMFHLGPNVVLAAVGAALGPLILRRI